MGTGEIRVGISGAVLFQSYISRFTSGSGKYRAGE